MTRRILLVAHPRRPEALTVAKGVVERLTHLGIDVSLQADEAKALDLKDSSRVHIASAEEQVAEGCDLVVVLGGDGTILRGAEFARSVDVPLLGVNLGHVGFLAEAERDDLDATVEHIASNDYAVEERMTLHVDAKLHGDLIASSWALNEVSVEKAARERMLEVTVEVDGRAAVELGLRRGHRLDAHGLDGLRLLGRRAGRLAAGRGDAPRSQRCSRALRPAARARARHPSRRGDQGRHRGGRGHVVRRPAAGRPAARCAHRGVPRDAPLRLARLTSAPFTDRLVAKFDLSVAGWRGNGDGDTRDAVDDVDGR